MARGKQISNPGGLFGQTADTDSQTVTYYVNAATAAMLGGDAVGVTTAGTYGVSVGHSTGVDSAFMLGIVSMQDDGNVGTDTTTSQRGNSYAVGALVPVVVQGIARVWVSSFTIARGAVLSASSIAGAVDTTTSVLPGVAVATDLETSTEDGSNDTIRAIIGRY